MPEEIVNPGALRAHRHITARRIAAFIVLQVTDGKSAFRVVAAFVLAHVLLWTIILTILKSTQDIHFDVAEAYAWGRSVLLGYGKHPPLSGWVAGVWFTIFPAQEWATYALAMATIGTCLLLCWFIAVRVVDRRRAAFTVVVLALYPIFNFKGFKYNADLAQLITMPLVVLAYLESFTKRTVGSGILLGLACALALMTKYWTLTVIGSVAIAALVHPERARFLRSPAPWVAATTFVVAMVPHVVWLVDVGFLPLLYAGETYEVNTSLEAITPAIGYLKHNFALLVPALAIALLAVTSTTHGMVRFFKNPLASVALPWSCRVNTSVQLTQAINIWIIQALVALGPLVGAMLFAIRVKSDWGIPLFFLTPLSLIAIPALRVRRAPLARICVVWLAITSTVLVTSPSIVAYEMKQRSDADGASLYVAQSWLSQKLTKIWHDRFSTPWSAVAGEVEIADEMTFYSPDHPVPFTPWQPWRSGLLGVQRATQLGFVGICATSDPFLQICKAWMKRYAANAEIATIEMPPLPAEVKQSPVTWLVYLVPPGRDLMTPLKPTTRHSSLGSPASARP